MRKRFTILAVAGLLLPCAPLWGQITPLADDRGDDAGEPNRLRHCLVTLINDVQVPAEEAGSLKAVEVKEGTLVRAEQFLAMIDDSKMQKHQRITQFELTVAQKQAEDDIDVQYQVKRAAVARTDWEIGVEANEKVRGALSETEIRRRKLAFESSMLAIDRAKRDLVVAGLNRDLAAVKLEAADAEIERRKVSAPFDGVVARIYKKRGEWVSPGDPILRLVQMDRLRVEGFVRASEFAPHEVFGKPVTIEVKLAHRRVLTFNATVGYVSPDIEATGEFRIWAEIDNQRENGHFLVRPGLMAEMVVHVNSVR